MEVKSFISKVQRQWIIERENLNLYNSEVLRCFYALFCPLWYKTNFSTVQSNHTSVSVFLFGRSHLCSLLLKRKTFSQKLYFVGINFCKWAVDMKIELVVNNFTVGFWCEKHILNGFVSPSVSQSVSPSFIIFLQICKLYVCGIIMYLFSDQLALRVFFVLYIALPCRSKRNTALRRKNAYFYLPLWHHNALDIHSKVSQSQSQSLPSPWAREVWFSWRW